MNVTDREQEKQKAAQSPEGKKKKLVETVLIVAVIVVFCIGIYIVNHNPHFTGEPHAVALGGVTAIPGTTTMGELAAAGYEFSDRDHAEWTGAGGYLYTEVLDLSAELEGRTYYDLVLVKDGDAYADIEVINEATSSKAFTECVLREVAVKNYHEGSDGVSVDGISFGQLSEAALTGAIGASPESVAGKYVWKKGNYSLSLELGDDGKVSGISSKYVKE